MIVAVLSLLAVELEARGGGDDGSNDPPPRVSRPSHAEDVLGAAWAFNAVSRRSFSACAARSAIVI